MTPRPEEDERVLDTPVVIIAFNRPAFAREQLETVRRVQPRRLYLVADGPRASRPEDADLCAEVRREFEEVDWDCEVTRLYSDVNRGCEASVELGLDVVFAREDRAIILEDDCFPDASFFPYVTELLERYADDERIWHVAGDAHFLPSSLFEGDSYAFTTYAGIWGWGTWARAWQRHRREFPRDHAGMDGRAGAPVRTEDPVPVEGALVTPAAYNHYRHIAATTDGEDYGWDSHWWLTVAHHGGLSVTPSINLVSNVGWGEDATHTRSTREPAAAVAMPFPLRHPADITLNATVQRELELVLLRANGRLANLVRVFIPSIRVRGWVRRIVHSRLVWGTYRRITAFRNRDRG